MCYSRFPGIAPRSGTGRRGLGMLRCRAVPGAPSPAAPCNYKTRLDTIAARGASHMAGRARPGVRLALRPGLMPVMHPRRAPRRRYCIAASWCHAVTPWPVGSSRRARRHPVFRREESPASGTLIRPAPPHPRAPHPLSTRCLMQCRLTARLRLERTGMKAPVVHGQAPLHPLRSPSADAVEVENFHTERHSVMLQLFRNKVQRTLKNCDQFF